MWWPRRCQWSSSSASLLAPRRIYDGGRHFGCFYYVFFRWIGHSAFRQNNHNTDHTQTLIFTHKKKNVRGVLWRVEQTLNEFHLRYSRKLMYFLKWNKIVLAGETRADFIFVCAHTNCLCIRITYNPGYTHDSQTFQLHFPPSILQLYTANKNNKTSIITTIPAYDCSPEMIRRDDP